MLEKLCEATIGEDIHGAVYDDDLGLLCASPTRGYAIVTLDGAAYTRSTYHYIGSGTTIDFILDLRTVNGYSVRAMPAPAPTPHIYERFDKYSGALSGDVIDVSGDIYPGISPMVRTQDRWLQFYGQYAQVIVPPFTAAPTNEFTFDLPIGSSDFATVSRTSKGSQVCTYWPTTGKVIWYDLLQKKSVGRVEYLPTGARAWYSRKHNVFVTLEGSLTTTKICVYAATPKPTSVGSVLAVDQLLQGHVSRVKVRVLGSNDEGCPNELVNWAVDVGSLLNAQSAADQDGWAWNKYIAPLTSGAAPVFSTEVVI